jgi:hypothetical protein
MCQNLSPSCRRLTDQVCRLIICLLFAAVLIGSAINILVNVEVTEVTVVELEINETATTGWCYYRLSNDFLAPVLCQTIYNANVSAWLKAGFGQMGLHQSNYSARSDFYLYLSLLIAFNSLMIVIRYRDSSTKPDPEQSELVDYKTFRP